MKLKLSLLVMAIFVLVGCGGGGSGETTPLGRNLTKIETIDQAKTNFQALKALNNLNTTNNTSPKSNKYFSLKTTSSQCDTGTVSVTNRATSSVVIANNCRRGTLFMNGTFSTSTLEDGSDKIEMTNLTVKNGAIELKTDKFVVTKKESEFWSTVDGDMSIVAKCFSGKYEFKTLEKLYDAQDGSDNVERGILELNGVRYIFDNPNVTIKTASNERTILQSDLEKEMQTTCSE